MITVARLRDAHLLPRAVSDALAADSQAAGVSRPAAPGAGEQQQPTYAWVLARSSTLLLWNAQDGLHAVVRRLTLPEPPAGPVFVEVVCHRQSSAVTVVVCTGGGQLHVWLDANFPAAPFSQRLAAAAAAAAADGSEDGQQQHHHQQQQHSSTGVICALAAAPADSSAGSPGFLAVVATADGALHLYHGSQAGIFPRQFHKAPSSGPVASLTAGVLGVIGSAVRAMYEEAFDPLHSLQRSSGSALPARAMQLAPLDGARWKLFVLTAESLDCWLLGSVGQQSTEQLLWSFNMRAVLAAQLNAAELELLAMTAASQGGQAGGSRSGQPAAAAAAAPQMALYVWSAHNAAASLKHQQHAMSCFAVEEGTNLPRLLGSSTLGREACLPQPQPHMRWQLTAHARLPSCLMLAHNGSVLEWLRPAGGPQLLGSSADNLAITASSGSADGSNWQLLNSKFGVLEFTPEGGVADAAAPADNLAAARALLQKAVDIMGKEHGAGYPYRELASGLGPALDGLGVLTSQEGVELLLEMSGSLVDALPKSGTLASSHLRSQLASKQVRHSLLLAALQEGEVLGQLPAADAAVLLQHAQMLAAAAEVLQWQRSSEAAASSSEDADAAQREAVSASAAAIKAAGNLTAAECGEAAAPDSQWEVFFSRPTVSIPALFQATAAEAARIRQTLATAADRSSSLGVLTAQLLGLSGVLLTAVAGAEARAAQLRAEMPDEARQVAASGASWLAGVGPREAWAQVAEGCLLAQHDLTDLAQQLQLSREAHLPALSALLAGLAATLQHQALQDGQLLAYYERLPQEHGFLLLRVAEAEVAALRDAGVLQAAADAAASGDTASPSFQAAKHALVWPLQELAVQHRCHALLYEVCELVEDTALLAPGQLKLHMQREMQASGGELKPDSLTRHVMSRLHREGHVKELLDLGRLGFQPQLQHFLAGRPNLLWMSQVQAGDLAGAAVSLEAAASGSSSGSLLQAKRLLCLTKLAAQAAGPQAGSSEQAKTQASVRLQQLQLQSDLLPGRDNERPLTTQQLAQAALVASDGAAAGGGLTGGAAAVVAVEALALELEQQSPEGFRRLWQAGWQAALQHTPLQQLAAQGAGDAQQRWQSEAYRAAVEGCALYQAVVRAAGAMLAAQQRLVDVNPPHELELVANGLLQAVAAQQGPAATTCLQDIMYAAARVSGLEGAAA